MKVSNAMPLKQQSNTTTNAKQLEHLLTIAGQPEYNQDEVDLLTLLIEKWDAEHSSTQEADPVSLLKYLMKEKNIKASELAQILDVNKSLVSDILHYKKGLSKEVIRQLAAYFKVSQEAFNRPYKLVDKANSYLKNASVMNTPKDIFRLS